MVARRCRSILSVVAALLIGFGAAGCSRYFDLTGERRDSATPVHTQKQPLNRAQTTFTPYPGLAVQQIPVPADGMHTVVRGNTVYAISRLYGAPVRSIIESNRLEPPYTLKVGDRLRISAPRRHTVVKGDTVYSLSRHYNVPMSELTRANGIAPPYTISVGRELSIPSAGVMPTPKTTPAQAPPKAPTKPQIAALPKPPPRSGKLFLWPVRGKIVARYGQQRSGSHNDGINIAASRGSKVLAAENGVVAYAGNELRGFGNLLLIKHADGFMTAYAHNGRLLVARGQKVKKGQTIAVVGSSGSVATPQLHFEIRKGRKAVDPVRYLPRQTAGN